MGISFITMGIFFITKGTFSKIQDSIILQLMMTTLTRKCQYLETIMCTPKSIQAPVFGIRNEYCTEEKKPIKQNNTIDLYIPTNNLRQ